MYVINLALRRASGLVEQDTIYSEKPLTKEDAQAMSDKYDCDVLLSHVGEIDFWSEKKIRANSFIIEKPKKEEAENATTANATNEGQFSNAVKSSASQA